jgi:diaminopimelate epimerase
MRLTKHQALGNDFLVLLDLRGQRPVTTDEVREACDRHLGIGADGLIRATAGTDGAAATMHLFNADGGRAEMSGNGVRCLAQALLQAGLAAPPRIDIATDAGLKPVTVEARTGARTHVLSVDMGEVVLGDEAPEWVGDDVLRAVRVDAGNPHLVLHVPDLEWGPDIATVGSQIDESTPDGINVHLMTPGPKPGDLTMVSWERGSGLTRACGTGACAAAVAAHAWELAGVAVDVHMPGGVAEVALGDTVTLRGPATSIAIFDWPWV